MLFYSVRDLRTYPKEIWEKLSETGEIVITNNGKPTAVMIEVDDANLEDTLATVRQANAMRAVNRMRLASERNGNAAMTDGEINDEIKAVREGR